jgi:hypothetical protein
VKGAKLRRELEALGFGDELDDVFRGANPNPRREGCPPNSVLVALSRRERPIDDPGWEHLLECSPCYGEVRDMQLIWVLAMAAKRPDDSRGRVCRFDICCPACRAVLGVHVGPAEPAPRPVLCTCPSCGTQHEHDFGGRLDQVVVRAVSLEAFLELMRGRD